jgi:hypothetical protein
MRVSPRASATASPVQPHDKKNCRVCSNFTPRLRITR